MTAEVYINFLREDLLGTRFDHELAKEDIIFQHDNDPKHTARATTSWLEKQQINTLPWPAQSPDLNPIERVWDEVDRRLRAIPTKPTGLNELWECVEAAWNGIEPAYINKLYESMKRRVEAVRKASGGYTKY